MMRFSIFAPSIVLDHSYPSFRPGNRPRVVAQRIWARQGGVVKCRLSLSCSTRPLPARMAWVAS